MLRNAALEGPGAKAPPVRAMPTHFDIFGLKPTLDVDAAALEQQFRDLSLKHHPDRQPPGDPKARLRAVEQTTSLNDAYKTLKDPVRRAFYVLKLEGEDLDREDAGAQKAMPLEFLEEVMELRERLESLKRAKDLEGAQKMGAEVEAQKDAALARAKVSLGQRLANHADAEALKQASYALSRVRYFTRFLEEVEKMEDEALS